MNMRDEIDYEEIQAQQDAILEERAAECPEDFYWELTVIAEDDGLCAQTASCSSLYESKDQAETDSVIWKSKGLKTYIKPVSA